jgi:hypothetical protein
MEQLDTCELVDEYHVYHLEKHFICIYIFFGVPICRYRYAHTHRHIYIYTYTYVYRHTHTGNIYAPFPWSQVVTSQSPRRR